MIKAAFKNLQAGVSATASEAGVFSVAVWTLLIVGLIVLTSLSFLGAPGHDPSIFIYIAQGMLEGDVPYLDRWDNKPPLIFLLNALGLILSPGHLWGIWSLEIVFLLGSVWFAFLALSKYFGVIATFFSITVFLLYFRVFSQGGNLTEQYALLFQFISLYLFACIERRDDLKPGLLFTFGLLGVGALLLKPNLIGLWLAAGVYWVFFRTADALKLILWSVSAAALVFLLMFGVFKAVGGWYWLWDANVTYQLAYTSPEVSRPLNAVMVLIKRTALFFPLIAAGWAIGVHYWLSGRLRENQPLLKLALIMLPIEVVLACFLSSRAYGHYFMTILPAATVILAFLVCIIARNYRLRAKAMTVVLLLMVFGAAGASVVAKSAGYGWAAPLHRIFQLGDIVGAKHRWNAGSRQAMMQVPLVKRVLELTQSDDHVLFWGSAARFQWCSQRESPTRFFHQHPLITPGYATEEVFNEFISGVKKSKPELIVDLTEGADYFPPLSGVKQRGWKQKRYWFFYPEQKFRPFFNFVEREYELIERVGRSAIYRRKDRTVSRAD